MFHLFLKKMLILIFSLETVFWVRSLSFTRVGNKGFVYLTSLNGARCRGQHLQEEWHKTSWLSLPQGNKVYMYLNL
jgi:hypothetical protein